MNILFLIFIVLFPFSPLFFKQIDLWYAAGHYFQIGLLIIFAYSFFEKQKRIQIQNIPLALLTLYIGFNTAWFWYQGLLVGKHLFVFLMPFFNFLCFLIFYRCSFHLNRKWIEKIITFLSYSLCIYLFYCALQFFDLDQFFKVFAYRTSPLHRTVGLIGNETQNATYLAMCLPIFYLNRNRFSILCACFIWVVIAISCSASAIIVALAVTIFFSIFYRLPKSYYAYIVLGAVGIVLLKNEELLTFYSPHSRLDIWQKLFSVIKETPIWGKGLGTMNLLAQEKEFLGWRHAHNEYLHFWFEIGIIGLVSIIYCVYEYFRRILKDRLSIVFASCFLGFCVASLLYYPSHLFLTSIMGMMGYSFGYVLKNEELLNDT